MPQKLKLKKIQAETPEEHFGDMDIPSKKIILPSIRINSDQMKEVKDWLPPEKYRLIVELQQTDMRVDKEGKVRAEFDLTAYKYLPKKSIDDMDDKEFGEYQDEQLSKR